MKQRAYLNGERNRELEKLTQAMWRMLFDTRDHGDPWHSIHGRSASGGASWTHLGLKKRGLMKGIELTDAGRAACDIQWRDK